MKRFLFLTLTLLALGCKNDPVDMRDPATGRYTGNATFYVLKGSHTLVQTDLVSADPINVSKVSGNDNLLIDFGDGDLATGTNLKSSSTGLTFDLDQFTGTGSNLHFTGYPGYESDGGHYAGGFNKDGNKLELWYQYTYNDTIKVTKCNMTKQ